MAARALAQIGISVSVACTKRSIFLLLVSSFVWRQTNSCCQAITALYKTEAFWLPIKFFILHCSLTLSPTRGVSVTYFIRRSPIFLISTTDLATRNRVIVLFHPHTFWDLLDWKDTKAQLPYLPAWHTLGCGVLCRPLLLGLLMWPQWGQPGDKKKWEQELSASFVVQNRLLPPAATAQVKSLSVNTQNIVQVVADVAPQAIFGFKQARACNRSVQGRTTHQVNEVRGDWAVRDADGNTLRGTNIFSRVLHSQEIHPLTCIRKGHTALTDVHQCKHSDLSRDTATEHTALQGNGT